MPIPFARPYNNQIGYDIIDILLKHDSHGLRYCEIKEEGNFYDKTLSGWLKRLELFNIIDRSKRYIRLTPEAKEKREQKTLVLSHDDRRKKKKTIFQTDRDRDNILFILFISAHPVFENKTVELDKKEGIPWTSITWRKDLVKDDLTTNELKRLYHPYMPNPPRFENRLNGCSLEIFRHIKIQTKEVEKYLTLLKDYKPYPVLIETQYNNQIRYEIEDKFLQDFIQRCLHVFRVDVYSILEFYYKNTILEKGQIKKYEEEYQRNMNRWFGPKQNYYSLNIFPDSSSRLANVNIEELERDLLNYYGMNISLSSSSSSSLSPSAVKVNVDEQLERAIKNIYKYQIFDDELKGINDNYKILEQKYPEIIEAIFDILFPRFFRDIIREEYIKMCSIRVT